MRLSEAAAAGHCAARPCMRAAANLDTDDSDDLILLLAIEFDCRGYKAGSRAAAGSVTCAPASVRVSVCEAIRILNA